MSDVLFVYGSLRSEFDNPMVRMLRAEAESLGPATVRGSIFRVGAYPAFQPEPDGVVRGERWLLRDPEKTLAVLDEYEGPEYPRVLLDGMWIYTYEGAIDPGLRIASGDFLVP